MANQNKQQDKPAARFFSDDEPKFEASPAPTARKMRLCRLFGLETDAPYPDAITPAELALIQFPNDELARGDLIRAAWGFEWSQWIGEHGTTVIRDNAPGPGLCRQSAPEFLRAYGVAPSDLVREWIDGNAQYEEQDELTPVKKSALLDQLDATYPYLASAMKKPGKYPWIREASTGRSGWYYKEKIIAGCRNQWAADSAVDSDGTPMRTASIRRIA